MNIEKIKEAVINYGCKDGLHIEQYVAAKEIIDRFMIKQHYVILKAKTQSGKTGVVMSLINLLNYNRTYITSLKIDRIYYVTAENQPNVKDQAMGDFEKYCLKYYFKDKQVEFLKNSDLQSMERRGLKKSLKNTLLCLDESHYGTKKEKNKVPSFLTNNSVNYMKNDESMIENNSYIISISATPDKEIANDEEYSKAVVELKTNEQYKGFEEFEKNGQIEDIDKDIFYDENLCYDFFMDKVLPHLDNIKKTEGKVKYVIMRRNNSNKSFDIEPLLSKYFDILYVEQKGKNKVNHSEMFNHIDKYCYHKLYDKYLLILIKNSYRQGDRIETLYKAPAGCVIDFCAAKDNVEATIQGLTGRFSGYVDKYNENEWMKIKFFISEDHHNKIRNYFKGYYTRKTIYDVHHQTKKWGVGENVGVNEDGFKINNPLKINIDDYFNKNEGEKEKMTTALSKSTLKTLNENIFKFYPFLNNYLGYEYVGSRKGLNKTNQLFFSTNTPDGGKAYLKKENLGKKCYKSWIYEQDGHYFIEIKESFFDVYDIENIKSSSTKKINTYCTA